MTVKTRKLIDKAIKTECDRLAEFSKEVLNDNPNYGEASEKIERFMFNSYSHLTGYVHALFDLGLVSRTELKELFSETSQALSEADERSKE